jgi:hypothetical protein
MRPMCESLEQRMLMDGNVTVRLWKSGVIAAI